MTGWIGLALGLLLAGAGTVVAVGTAAVSRIELSRWISGRLRGAALATALLSAPTQVLGTANALATAGTIVAAFGLGAVLGELSPLLALGVLIAVIPVLLVLVYAMPRAAGRRWAEPVMRFAGPGLELAARIASPFIPAPLASRRSDLEAVLRSPDADDPARAQELSVLAGVIAFTERPVREVMTPRTEIVAVAEDTPIKQVATIFRESGYTRIPVYRASLDHIVGMIHAFDLLKVEGGTLLPLRPVTVAPASRHCADLLLEMQRERRQFAVVLDEFGGTAGIATLEDLLEELVGEIFDEHDVDVAPRQPEVELVDVGGAEPCDELATRFQVEFPAGSETVGGLLASRLGRIPRTGERLVIAGLEFDVLGATPTRVERVIVRRSPVAHTVVRWVGTQGQGPR